MSTITSHGYELVYVGKDHHLADVRGYAYKHRVVAEQKLGRKLQHGEIVHHINGNKLDNRPDNLDVATSLADHLFHHRKTDSKLRIPDEPNPVVFCACGCGETLYKSIG